MGDQLFFGVDYAGYESRSRLQRAQIQAGLPLGYGIKIDTTNRDAPAISEIELKSSRIMRDWIDDCSPHPTGLRLVVEALPDNKDFREMINEMSFPSDGDRRGGSLMLASEDMHVIVNSFSLPRSTPWMIRSQTSHFQRYSIASDKKIGMTLRQSTRGGLQSDLSLALTYDRDHGHTSGFLTGCTKRQAAYVIVQLRLLAQISDHPLLLPTMILGYMRSFLGRRTDEAWIDLIQVETESGQTRWPRVGPDGHPVLSREAKNTKRISGDVLGVIQSVTIWQSHLEELSILTKSVQECSSFLARKRNRTNSNSVLDSTDIIDERLRFISCKTKILLSSLTAIKERTHAQMSAVYNFIGEKNNDFNRQLGEDTQEIARASKHDSSAMKSIAVLTIVFLPGAYLATLFDMSFFNWAAQPGQPVVSARFWIYWAFTIPITLLVLSLWLLTSPIVRKKIARWLMGHVSKESLDEIAPLASQARPPPSFIGDRYISGHII